jgi:hypothetical protein
MKPVGGSSVNKKSDGGSWVISKAFGGNPVICRISIDLILLSRSTASAFE